jgi:hypothetical protein
MRLVLGLLALAASLAVVGCGANSETSGAGTQTASTQAEQVDTSSAADLQKPPPIVLESAAGKQTAVPGSYCVQYTDEAAGASGGVCADTGPIAPAKLSTIHRGETVRIVFEDAKVVRSVGCSGAEEQDCIGSVAVHPLCKRKTVESIPLALGPETAWRVDLDPGRYELDVFAYFEAPNGRSGDVSGSLGVLVDDSAPLEIVPAPAPAECAAK